MENIFDLSEPRLQICFIEWSVCYYDSCRFVDFGWLVGKLLFVHVSPLPL